MPRDVRGGRIDPARLVPYVAVVWGWPGGPNAPRPDAAGLFPGEKPDDLPVTVELQRRIRSTCAA